MVDDTEAPVNKYVVNREISNANKKVLEDILSSLKTQELDVNLFVDGNHFKIAIDDGVKIAQAFHDKVHSYFKSSSNNFDKVVVPHNYFEGPPAQFILNKESYGRVVAQTLGRFYSHIEDKYHHFFKYDLDNDMLELPVKNMLDTGLVVTEKSLRRIFDPFVFSAINNNKKLSEEDFTKQFQETYNRKLKDAIHYKVNFFINFFMGNKPDLAYYLKVAQKRNFRQEDIIDMFKKVNARQPAYTEFRNAIIDFDQFAFRSEDMISQVNFGITKGDFRFDRARVNLEFNEKMVDTKIVISALDAFHTGTNNTAFFFLTNDSDFQPLFERIRTKYPLLWSHGNSKDRGSRDLKEFVKPTDTYLIQNFLSSILDMPDCVFDDLALPNGPLPERYDHYVMQYQYDHQDWEALDRELTEQNIQFLKENPDPYQS